MKRRLFFPGLVMALFASIIVSLMLGRYPVKASEMYQFVFHSLFGGGDLGREQAALLRNILLDIRAPRVMAAVLTGAALSTSGAAFQSMFINPLVSPGLLGVLAGASFGAAVGMVASKCWAAIQAGSFLFGLVAVLLALAIAGFHRGDRLLMLILGGIVSGSLFTSFLSVIKYVADPYDELPAIVYWLMGGFSLVNAQSVLVICVPVIASILLSFFLAGQLNVLTMGDEEARSLGVNVGLIRMAFVLLATLMSSATVILGGVIGWVGLVIPHIGRMIVGPDNRVLLPASAIIGATYLLLMDDLSRLLFQVEIPIGIMTSLLGIPFFAVALKKAKKGWN